MPSPLVAVIMGSKSDWDTMSHAAAALDELGVPYEKHVVSAHRTPKWMAEFAEGAEARGLEVIIAGAGGAAHLPGMVAAHTVLPVLGVPVQSAALQGLDSLLSIVQMPGGVPVATLAIGKAGAPQRGAAGGRRARHVAPRAAQEAARVPRRADQGRARRLAAVNRIIQPGATLGVLGSGQLGRMFAIAARRMGYRVHTLSPGIDTPDRPGGRRGDRRRLRRPRRDSRVRPRRRRRHLRVRERVDRRGRRRGRDRAGAAERPRAARHPAAGSREGVSGAQGLSRDALRAGGVARGAHGRARSHRHRRPSSRPPASATTARASIASPRRSTPNAVWALVGHQAAVLEKRRGLHARVLGRGRARPRRRVRALRRHRELASAPHPRRVGRAGARCPPRRWPRRSR